MLPTKLKNKLKRLNKHLVKFGGNCITESQAINFNETHRPQSGFEAGSIAFDISGCPDKYNGLSWHSASTNYYHWIGDALIDISSEMSGIDYQ